MCIRDSLSNYQIKAFQKAYGLNEQVELFSANSMQVFNRLTQNVQRELRNTLAQDPEKLEEREYLDKVNTELKSKYSYLIVRYNDEIVYSDVYKRQAMGMVTDENGRVVWNRVNRGNIRTLGDVEAQAAGFASILREFDGTRRMDDGSLILDCRGFSIPQILYFIDRGNLVAGYTEGGAYLLIYGFDPYNCLLYTSFEYKTRTADANDIYSYGFAFTSSDLDDAVKSLADILPDMLRLSEIEKACQLMAAEIEKTRRRVNALEHVIIPETRENIKFITMKLDENERSTQIRLMKVKDMMLEEAHHYSERQ